MPRTPQEIFDHHVSALVAHDTDGLLADYGDNSVLITAAGVARGKEQIRAVFSNFSDALTDAVFDIKVYGDDVLLLEWVLDSPAARIDGVDTFVFTGDVINLQTISQIAQPKG